VISHPFQLGHISHSWYSFGGISSIGNLCISDEVESVVTSSSGILDKGSHGPEPSLRRVVELIERMSINTLI
jgi:hypothetical protein